MTTQEQTADILLSINAVSLNLKKPFRYSSGILSPVYTDCRLLISDPVSRKKIIKMLVSEVKRLNKKVDVIAGTATAGIPHAAWIAESLELPMVYVRGKVKDHGKGNQIEGKIEKGQNVIVIEDLISTGGSSIESVKALEKIGAKIQYVLSIMTYGMKSSEIHFKKSKIKYHSLTNFETVVVVAQKKKMISEHEIKNILLWSHDPQGWGEKMRLH